MPDSTCYSAFRLDNGSVAVLVGEKAIPQDVKIREIHFTTPEEFERLQQQAAAVVEEEAADTVIDIGVWKAKHGHEAGQNVA